VNVEIIASEVEERVRLYDISVYGHAAYYGPNLHEAYAVGRRVVDPDREEYEPWEPLTQEFVQQLAKGLGVDLPREVLPANMICRTQDVIVWWTPPTVRTLFFAEKCKLAPLDGEDFPVPGLVWKLELADKRLFLRAIAGRRRPAAGTPLYVAPFLNVYDDSSFGRGLVCQGTMRRPKLAGVGNLHEWEDGFFGAAGSSQLAKRATTRTGQLFTLWRSLKGRKTFPRKDLLEAGESLAQFVGGR
jgi:PRTRC genetic system protein B